MQQRSTESVRTDVPELQGCDAPGVEATADLPCDNTADLVPVLQDEAPAATKPTAPPASSERLPLPITKHRTLGFFAFAACAITALVFSTERDSRSARPTTDVVRAASLPTANPPPVGPASHEPPKAVEPQVTPVAKSARDVAAAKASLPTLAFESRSFTTSEKAVAAVFILKRTQTARGRALVHWAALSGSADAGIDFSDASGTARFADGQRQLAIYVPLRNDLLKEKDETFKVCLRSAGQARIAGKACAEATIRDDDHISPT